MNDKKKKRGENQNRMWVYIGVGMVALTVFCIVTVALIGVGVADFYATMGMVPPELTATP